MKETNLDNEEQELLESFERGGWKPAKNAAREMAKHRRYARDTLRKDRRVNIRVSSKDIEQLQALAVEDGIPYQTLMASILHRYASGSLVQRERRSGGSS